MSAPLFVTGIGTDVGKTLISAILCQALQADYWKPIQCGGLDETDTMRVRSLVSNQRSRFHPERYKLKTPCSPHAAAEIESVSISLREFSLPTASRPLVIEGAGGLLVPINERETVADLILALKAEAIVVSRHYLGSINHSLMTLETLRHRGILCRGVIFNGPSTPASEAIITKLSGCRVLGRVGEERAINPDVVESYAEHFRGVDL